MAERRALIVANDRYDHEGLRSLGAPLHDAEALKAVLADPHIGRFTVRVVQNQPSHVLRREVADFFAECEPDDLLLLHFSGHGVKNLAGELFLAGTDTLPSRLKATALAAQDINQEMADSPAHRIVVFLDCCYGGAFPRGIVVRAGDGSDVEDPFPAEEVEGRCRLVISASSATEFALEEDRLVDAAEPRPAIFTGVLVEGLTTGEADTDRDGLVGLDELYNYVYARVRATTNRRQSPVRWGANQGNVAVAWAPPAARIKAVDVPDELITQARDGLRSTRLEVVKRLRQILLDEDVARAAGALDLVRQLTSDDSLEVSAAAMATVEEAQLRLVPTGLDAGDLRPGDPPSTHTVRLAGSPLARVFQASSATRWLTVEQSEPGAGDAWVRVTVDPARLPETRGEVSGSVRVVNRLGELRIPVTARSTGRLLPRAVLDVSGHAGWLRDARVLALAGAGAVLAAAAAAGPMVHYASVLGVGYLLLRAAVLIGAIVLAGSAGTRLAVGHGLAVATTIYLLSHGAANIHGSAATAEGSAMASAWFEFLAGIVFAGLLVIRRWPLPLWPLPDVLRGRPNLASPAGRPAAWVVMAAMAALFVLLFVAFPVDFLTSTVTEVVGAPAALLSVAPIAVLCLVTVLAAGVTAAQRAFVATAVVAYFGPEVYLMLGSLPFGSRFTYYGNNVWGHYEPTIWFVFAQAAAAVALTASTLAFLRTAPAPVR